jgi:hypothetical protein
MRDTGVPSRTSSGSVSTILEIGRPFQTSSRFAFEQRPLLDVQVPVGDADGQVAERVRRDVDPAGEKPVVLHRGEGSIVPDDLGDRIRRRHAALSFAIV